MKLTNNTVFFQHMHFLWSYSIAAVWSCQHPKKFNTMVAPEFSKRLLYIFGKVILKGWRKLRLQLSKSWWGLRKLTLREPIWPLQFFTSFFKTRQHFSKKNYMVLETSICDHLMVDTVLGVDPTQNYGKNTKSLRFHRFCYKNLLKINFSK